MAQAEKLQIYGEEGYQPPNGTVEAETGDVVDEIQQPEVGQELDGYRFKGGDPSQESNWEIIE